MMNKREQAEMDEMRRQLAIAKAFRWPDYKMPWQKSKEGADYDNLITGWFQDNYNQEFQVNLGCSDGVNHSSNQTDRATTRGSGVMYKTRLDALKVARLEMTKRFAEALAEIDTEIKAEENQEIQT